ncbi:MAG: response regulator [Bacteroidota bacterium]|nr:response regulator [Bacteroidota bacterium]MDP4192345.1 response regulator [Bacteroidota bacterium]MDP4196938.1 response regulator [Bacteroidota bacterium]
MEILLIEDSVIQALIISELLKDNNSQYNLTILNDGEKAINYLFRKGLYKNVPLPDIVILDLNLPKVNGFDILSEIQKHEELRNVKVVILTSSEDEDDKSRARQLGALEYFIKPFVFTEYQQIIDQIVVAARQRG